MKAFIVGGTFDQTGGRPSKIVSALGEATGWESLNGGHLDVLADFKFENYDALVWMPNIDNAEDKILPRIKAENPSLTLISSKRIVEKDYSGFDVVARLLKSRSNLGIAIRKTPDDIYTFGLMDPLGNLYCQTADVNVLADSLKSRVAEIKAMSRIGSVSIDSEPQKFELEPGFISLVRRLGDEFSRHVNAVNPERFLGNASARPTDRITRCCHGFPSVRKDDVYLISRRNVDKTTLSDQDFVAVRKDEDKVRFYGDIKPSVDAPIQIRLLNHFNNVNFIVHGHTYIEGAPLTHSKIPCGHVEEFDEIRAMVPNTEASNFGVNLRGHGCLIFAKDLDYLGSVQFQSRPFPEI